MELYQHQKDIIAMNPLWHGLWLGTGSSKTRTSLELAEESTLVIVEKQLKLEKKFEEENKKFNINKNITVMSKEEFRKLWDEIPYYDTVITDEAHNFFGVSTDTQTRKGIIKPKTSQMFLSLYNYLNKHKPKRFYPLTATPMSKPMNLYAIAALFGRRWDFFKFRSRFYIERKKGFRSIWIPRGDKSSQDRLIELLKEFGTTGKLDDWFDVPEQTHRTVHVEPSVQQRRAILEIQNSDADPMSVRARVRTVENGILYNTVTTTDDGKEFIMSKETQYFDDAKIPEIVKLCEEFPKVLVFANYTAQVERIAKELSELGYNVSTLTGKTKDRNSVIENARNSEKSVMVIQAQISAGYELPGFTCTIFASKNNRFLCYQQALGRTLRANHLQKNLFVHLVTKGGPDEACHKSIMTGEDFYEKQFND